MPTKPEWTPPDAGSAFATRIVQGVEAPDAADTPKRTSTRRRELPVESYVDGVLAGNRTITARAITLIESSAPDHFDKAQEVLRHLLPHTGQSMRIGITGVPGAGKSTLIEAFGTHVIEHGQKVAVLAVDPTSSITGGSILGDKTRMENLSKHPNAYIRPSPTGGVLGGVARKTREALLICEAAGFDVILIETVGTGQSEIAVRSMVDFFLLVLITGAGDELQGIKKGVIEIADAVLINKADGENKIRAQAARAEYNRALHYLAPATEGWQTRAYAGSALTREGIPEVWDMMTQFHRQTSESGAWTERRRRQTRDWLYALVEEYLQRTFYQHPRIRGALPHIEQAVLDGTIPVTAAARDLLAQFLANSEA
jgi:LAO/AO transport system kinase